MDSQQRMYDLANALIEGMAIIDSPEITHNQALGRALQNGNRDVIETELDKTSLKEQMKPVNQIAKDFAKDFDLDVKAIFNKVLSEQLVIAKANGVNPDGFKILAELLFEF